MTHEPYFRYLSRYFFAPGYDAEDLLQEARIAAWLVPGRERIAARRQLVDIVRTARRHKRPTLVSMAEEPPTPDVAELVEQREQLRSILAAPRMTTERVAVGRALRGEPIAYEEKALQRALWRVRRRLEAA